VSRTDPQFKLRVPPALRDQIERAALAARRSMNAEVVIRLESTFAPRQVPAGIEPMSQTDHSVDVCSVGTFAAMCGASTDEVIAWMDSGTIPSVKVADFRMVNLAKIKADLDGGKGNFGEGDYDDE
jgi:hypothetical protein